MSDRDNDAAQVRLDRRALVTKLAVGAFAVPAIVAFKLDSLARAGGFSHHPRHSDPDCHLPNGAQPNGTLPDSGNIPNSTVPDPPDDDDRKKKKKKRKGHGH